MIEPLDIAKPCRTVRGYPVKIYRVKPNEKRPLVGVITFYEGLYQIVRYYMDGRQSLRSPTELDIHNVDLGENNDN